MCGCVDGEPYVEEQQRRHQSDLLLVCDRRPPVDAGLLRRSATGGAPTPVQFTIQFVCVVLADRDAARSAAQAPELVKGKVVVCRHRSHGGASAPR